MIKIFFKFFSIQTPTAAVLKPFKNYLKILPFSDLFFFLKISVPMSIGATQSASGGLPRFQLIGATQPAFGRLPRFQTQLQYSQCKLQYSTRAWLRQAPKIEYFQRKLQYFPRAWLRQALKIGNFQRKL